MSRSAATLLTLLTLASNTVCTSAAWKQRADDDTDRLPPDVQAAFDAARGQAQQPSPFKPPPRPALRLGPFTMTTLQRWSNTGNGALLLLSAPIQWRLAGGFGAVALRGLALSSWVSVCGLLLLLREIRLPWMRRFLRRHARFATTAHGKSLIHLFAATLALSSGTIAGSLLGSATLANVAFGRYVRRRARAHQRGRAPRMPPMVEAPVADWSFGGDDYHAPPPSMARPSAAPLESTSGEGEDASWKDDDSAEALRAAAERAAAEWGTLEAKAAAAERVAAERVAAEARIAAAEVAATKEAEERVAAESAAAAAVLQQEEERLAAEAKAMEEEERALAARESEAASEVIAAAKREAEERAAARDKALEEERAAARKAAAAMKRQAEERAAARAKRAEDEKAAATAMAARHAEQSRTAETRTVAVDADGGSADSGLRGL